jgi:hypothetical protein
MASDSPEREGNTITVTTEIGDERTVVSVDGDRDVAVVINSASGERVYLPPDVDHEEATSSPAKSGDEGDTPYEGIQDDGPYEGLRDDSPYEGLRDDSPYEGMQNGNTAEEVPNDSPYEGIQDGTTEERVPSDSPYEGIETDGPYEGIPEGKTDEVRGVLEAPLGVTRTADGFRIVHPEPATDVRFLR